MADVTSATGGFFKGVHRRDLVFPVGLISILGLMIVPLPPLIVDLLLAVSVTLSVVVLLTAVQVRETLDFSVFPSVLLITTLFRLALNVSTTRLILLEGGNGTDAAGDIIRTFGEFVVGGSYVVGIVVFLILTLINFVVITKGSGRIAEVSARFTLDALPGKQMSIDSDLAAGLVTQDEARKRRELLALETDFFGAMDGSSKFVRGDAIAGLLITAINIIGGFVIGIMQNGMSPAEAAETYTVLTIGDGLVAQIPTLLISTAAGVVVTRSAESSDLGQHLVKQLFQNPKVLTAGALIMVMISLVPGMPKVAFFGIAAGLLFLARKSALAAEADDGGESRPGPSSGSPLSDEEQLASSLPVEALELELGYGLVPLADADGGGELVSRITALRREFAKEMGLILPSVHLRDNLELAPGGYRLMVHGVEVASGTVEPERLMAMDPGNARGPLRGVSGTDPTFGMEVTWIRSADKSAAELAGYTVVEPVTVIVTHITDILHRDADKLLGRAELQVLLDVVSARSSRIIDELMPEIITHAELLSVLRALLRERVSIRDLTRILEVLAEVSRFGKSIPFLVDQVRLRLGSAIVQRLRGSDGKLHAALFNAASEDALRRLVIRNESDVALTPDLQTAQSILGELKRAVGAMHDKGYDAVVITPQDLRYPMWRFASRFLPQLAVLGNNELPPRIEVVTEAELTVQSALAGRPVERGAPSGAPAGP